jgi:hypothetical protein
MAPRPLRLGRTLESYFGHPHQTHRKRSITGRTRRMTSPPRPLPFSSASSVCPLSRRFGSGSHRIRKKTLLTQRERRERSTSRISSPFPPFPLRANVVSGFGFRPGQPTRDDSGCRPPALLCEQEYPVDEQDADEIDRGGTRRRMGTGGDADGAMRRPSPRRRWAGCCWSGADSCGVCDATVRRACGCRRAPRPAWRCRR